MSRQHDVWSGLRSDIPFAVKRLFAKTFVEVVDLPSIVVVRVPISPIGVIPSAIIGIIVIPASLVKSPAGVNFDINLVSLRDHNPGGHSDDQSQANHREPKTPHDVTPRGGKMGNRHLFS